MSLSPLPMGWQLGHNESSELSGMDDKAMHDYAVTYHCGEEWGEEMLQSADLGQAVEAAHALFPSSCRISILEVKPPARR